MPASTPENVSSFYQSISLSTDSRSIRVLDLQGSPRLDNNGPLQGTLRTVDLDQHPNFFALSYVCGASPTGDHLVDCKGVSIAVPENCYNALKHLFFKLGSLTIWVDAICIHQQDDMEKARQIAFMGYIFSCASKVYVWLGKGDDDAERAMEQLKHVEFLNFFTTNGDVAGTEFESSQHWRAMWVRYCACWSRSSPWMAIVKRVFKREQGSSDGGRSVDAGLPKLLSNEWIQRIWTYQEILFAPNAVVVYGKAHLTWSTLAYGIVFQDMLEYSDDRIPSLPSWRRIVFTKAHFEMLQDESCAPFMARLQRYQSFIYRVESAYLYFRMLAAALLALLYLIAVVSCTGAENRPWSTSVFLVIFYGGMVLSPLLYMITLEVGCQGGFPFVHKRVSKRELKSKASSSEGLLDALSTRKASVDLDMAFAVQAVLGIMLRRDLPISSPNDSKEHIYRHLTTNVVNATGTLQSLATAAIPEFRIT